MFQIISTDICPQEKRMEAFAPDQSKINSDTAKSKITTALTRYIPPAGYRTYECQKKHCFSGK